MSAAQHINPYSIVRSVREFRHIDPIGLLEHKAHTFTTTDIIIIHFQMLRHSTRDRREPATAVIDKTFC